eukprot:CAMPEP_0170546920 /NCGR_PEP_ID=MMETSP0211-20121228/5297_1 /TAXON_ID=311385 /ORGANISM="Pseudokeronopsis sp., Strain OXSARD2" /LENGTH=73 /DNA_ID=CAMNT_0010851645 /DNA_START=289 /DNA_END=510 /DNA_ORIENTATION=+
MESHLDEKPVNYYNNKESNKIYGYLRNRDKGYDKKLEKELGEEEFQKIKDKKAVIENYLNKEYPNIKKPGIKY